MRKWNVGAALVCVALVTCTWAGERRGDDDKLDKKALDILKPVGELYKNAKSMHADYTVQSTMDRGGDKREMKLAATCDLEKPNHFALRTKPEGKKEAGLTVVSDGKKLFISRPKQYTEGDAPSDLKDFGTQSLMPLQFPNTGMLFVNVLGADPYEQLMEGVTDVAYAGKEKLDGVETHHLTFKQPGFDWQLWIAVEGKPFILKMQSNGSDDNKFEIVENYRNWKVDEAPAKDVFTFTPDKDAKKVEDLSDGEGEDKDK